MAKNTRLFLIALAPLALTAACSGNKGTVQPISGKLALSTFDGSVTRIRAMRSGVAAVEAPVAADGTFALSLPKGAGYRLEFLKSTAGSARLVFPRQAGALQWTFDVLGAGTTFDLGTVRYVGDPKGLTVTFVAAQTVSDADGGTATHPESECEDGKDRTGAVCVDDQDEGHHGGKCQAGKSDSNDGGADDSECENGKDTKTGLACQDTEDDGKSPPAAAAVADHNLPAAIGACGGEGGDDKNDGKDDKEVNDKK